MRIHLGALFVLLALGALPALASPPTMTGDSSVLAHDAATAVQSSGPLTVWRVINDPAGANALKLFDARRAQVQTIVGSNDMLEGATDGSVVAYTLRGGLFLFDPATKTTSQLLSTAEGLHSPTISSRVVAWVSGTQEVVVFDRATKETRRLPRTVIAELPVAGGSKVFYVDCTANGSGLCDAAVVRGFDVASGSSVTITPPAQTVNALDFDGTNLVANTVHDSDRGDFSDASLRVYDASGALLARLVGVEAAFQSARISGEWVLFGRDAANEQVQVGLWHWTTGDVFFPAGLTTTNVNPGLADLDLTRVVAASSSGDLVAYDFGLARTVKVSNTFDACTSTSDLGAFFQISGTWYCKAARARGESANGLALSLTRPMNDTDVQALVQRNGSSGSGLAVRAQGGSAYEARLLPNAVQLVRVNAGVATLLASAPATIADVTSYTLRLKASGQSPVSLAVALNGATLIDVSDSSSVRLLSGSAGLYSGSDARTQFDNYVLTGTAVGTSLQPAAFGDSFVSCSTGAPSTRWLLGGDWTCSGGEASGSPSAATALLDLPAFGKTTIQAEIAIGTQGGGGGLILRQNGNAFYAARVLASGMLQIIKVQDGSIKVLSEGDTHFGAGSKGSMRFSIDAEPKQPGLLLAQYSGTQVAAIDASSTPLLSGRAGLLAGEETTFDDIFAEGTPGSGPKPPAGGVFFSDTFDTCTSTSDLGTAWEVNGTWYCRSGRARGESEGSTAIARTAVPSEVTVQARVQLTSSATGSGVVARDLGTNSFYYAARLLGSGRAQIVRVGEGSDVVLLADVPFSVQPEPASYAVRLQVSGLSPVNLTMSVNGTQVASAVDSSDNRLPFGSVGLLSGSLARTQFDDFTARSP